ncbi:MAG: UDP-N-acetylmuramoyl-tripeptide--D-alanyl-D-alanine ligase [Gammaproteobacteria bacterium]|nr:UDP-N-acetylmuramoyl-tripeptide--D-alanyl-D-alanine ligase [Gammaproteobacteria bacterium]MDH3466101.1 UDP-N-acetylmuramoyl-tripeptide--D-alanyl-D-alanine ligase [Gammaproteobacteria bacterium]
MTLQAAAGILGSSVRGGDVEFNGVSIDSRTTREGDLFVALRGPNFDGHDFVTAAVENGAVAALIIGGDKVPVPSLTVKDTYRALGQLAADWRRRFELPVIAITGSNGKTTVKQMVGTILRARDAGVVAEGNLNNHIGMPLTLLRLRDSDRFAVLELGMNHPGEISYLTAIAQPTIAVINNAAAAHLQGLGSIGGVARAKGEIFEGLRDAGIAVINIDDRHAALWMDLTSSRRRMTFGLDPSADVSATYSLRPDASDMTIITPAGQLELTLPLPGVHNVRNALAATAASLAAGAQLADIKQGLERVAPVAGRVVSRRGIGGAAIIDDSYNANPASLYAALEVLAAQSGERLLVLGDMNELGSESAALHTEAGIEARRAGVNGLYAVGAMSRHTVRGFGDGAHHFDNQQALIAALEPRLHAGVTALVKGSRGTRMERVVAALLADAGADRVRH